MNFDYCLIHVDNCNLSDLLEVLCLPEVTSTSLFAQGERRDALR